MSELNDDSPEASDPMPATEPEVAATCATRGGNGKTTVFGALFGAAAAVPTWTTAGFLSLFGLAGGSAVSIAGWMSPILIGVTVVAMGRSHYVLYVLKRGNLASTIITWTATVAVIGFWSWQWFVK